MKVAKVLLGLTMTFTMVSAVVFAADSASQANVDETYKKVLMPGTTVVTGYPDKNEFYVVSEKEMPVLLAELSQRRDFDELKLLAAEHDKVHQAIKLNHDMVLALNTQVKRLQSENPQPVKSISVVSADKQLEFKYHPDNNVPMTPAATESDGENLAVKVANQFRQSLIHVAHLDKPVNKSFKPQSLKIKQSEKHKKPVKLKPVKSAKKTLAPKTPHRVRHAKSIKQAGKRRPAVKFKVIEYSDIIAKKKSSNKHAVAVKHAHKKFTRQQHTDAGKKAVHRSHKKPVHFVVKKLKLDKKNHLVLVDSAA